MASMLMQTIRNGKTFYLLPRAEGKAVGPVRCWPSKGSMARAVVVVLAIGLALPPPTNQT